MFGAYIEQYYFPLFRAFEVIIRSKKVYLFGVVFLLVAYCKIPSISPTVLRLPAESKVNVYKT
jgi:hypothetical protein